MSYKLSLTTTKYYRQAIKVYISYAAIFILSSSVLAGDFSPAAGQTDSTAIAHSSPSILGWASGFLGYDTVSNPSSNCKRGSNIDIEFQTPIKALNFAGDSNNDNNQDFTFDIVSLGRGGCIILTFDTPITNGTGFDFAVFENSISDGFLELARIEVSSNGVDFIQFSGISQTPSPISSFGDNMDATNISNFAGKYRSGFGTPFDLEEVKNLGNNVDVNSITHIKIIDIVGNGSEPDGNGFAVYDPYPTDISAGFDLDAVAVMHFAEPVVQENVPIPVTYLFILALLLVHLKRSSKHVNL